MAREQQPDGDPEASLRDDDSTTQSATPLKRRDYLRGTGLLVGAAGLGAAGFGAVGQPAVAADGLSVEVRSVTTDHGWTTVELSGSHSDPVVLAPTLSYRGPQPASTRLRDVGSSAFDVAVEEWLYLDGSHRVETLGCLVTDPGSYSLGDGSSVEVGRVSTDHRWASASFSTSFSTTPVVFSQEQTVNGAQPVVTRHRNVSASGFEVRLQEEEAQGPHRVEDIGFLAVEPGSGTLDGRAFEAGTQSDVTGTWRTVGFEGTYQQPVFLAALQTFRGANTAGVRYRNLGDSSVEVKVEEERSGDAETAHLGERVGYLVVEGATKDDSTTTEETTTDDGSSDGDTPLSELDRSRVEERVHAHINDRRAEHGLPALNFDTELREIARYHSEDMAKNDYFAHTSPGGESMGDRYDKFGYDCRASTGSGGYYTGAENIAYTYYDTNVRTDSGTVRYTNADELAEGIVTGWMNSEGHRHNILIEAWDDEGIGVYVTDAGKVYATQNFC